jgi:EAL domain-containing protein (putative c-di-GMP-specific phosphodiesterase class I)
MLLEQLFVPGALKTLYQPIVALDEASSVYGVECLTRGPAGTNLERADVLFDYVRAKRASARVDRLCIATAFANLPQIPQHIAISLNVHAATIAAPDAFAFLIDEAAHYGIEANRIIIEVVEHTPALDSHGFVESVHALRAAGIRFALDDFGNGHSSLRLAMDVAPELIKLDRSFIDGCSSDARRRSAIAFVNHFAVDCGSMVIAEGVETADDAKALRDLGVALAQGYYFAKPLAAALLPLACQGEISHAV